MRRAAWFLGPFTLVAGAVFACEADTTTGGGPTFQLDGSVPPFDAGQAPFDAGQAPFDAGVPDSGPDAPSGSPSVTVTVTGRTGPKADVRVVFHDANGAVLETKLTDASGKATSTGTLPSMASALLGTSGQRQIVTWTGLEDGDDLAVREPEIFAEVMVGEYEVTIPSRIDDMAARYDVHVSGCSNGLGRGTSATVALWDTCVSGDKSAVLVRAYDGDTQPVSHSFKKANPVPTDGGTVAVLTGPWMPATPVTITATNTPEGASFHAQLLAIADGYGYEHGFDPLADGSVTFFTADGFAEALQSSIMLSSGSGRRVIAKRVAPGPAISFDAAQLLPEIEGMDIGGTDARRPVISWTASSTAGTDGGIVRVFFSGQDGGNAWTFVVPPGATSVTAPAMPPEAESFLPASDAGPNAFWRQEATFIEADVIPSYKAFRNQQGTLFPVRDSFFAFPVLPANGTYRMTSWVPLPS